MSIYSSFDQNINTDHIYFSLQKGKWDNILNYLKSHSIACYIKDDEMERFEPKSKDEKKSYLKQHILPDLGNIKSGDFGEIFTYFFLLNKFQKDGKELFGPKKWKWKDHKNKSAPFSDVVFCHVSSDLKPRSTDFLISAEAKMCATKPGKNDNRIQEAIDGANKDRLTRLAETINWLETKYERDGFTEKAKMIQRFNDPVNNPYGKQYFAVAVIDELYLHEQTSKGFSKRNDSIIVYIISLNDLQKLYEKYFEEIINGN